MVRTHGTAVMLEEERTFFYVVTILHMIESQHILYLQVPKHSDLAPSQNSYNGKNMRKKARTLHTSRETEHTAQNQQTKVTMHLEVNR